VTALSFPLTAAIRESDASVASRAEISRLRIAAATRAALQRQMATVIDVSQRGAGARFARAGESG
jgi:hypothetical protein